MKDEYIIINKTAIQKRIEELEKQLNTLGHTSQEEIHAQGYLSGKIQQLRETLSQSTPLIPEIEKAFDAGTKTKHSIGCNADGIERKCYCTHERYCQYPIFSNIQDYISNLKLDI